MDRQFASRGLGAPPPSTPQLKQIVDAFSYNTMLMWLPERYFPNALAQLDTLRRAANHRARWFVVPDDIDQPIAPYDTLYYQINIAGGSYLWGYQFTSLSATQVVIENNNPIVIPVATAPSDLLIQAVDSCTGIPLFQDFANGLGLHSDFTARCGPILLSQPRLILEPGLVNVQIANRTGNSITCQLLLMFAEPCRLIDEEDREREIETIRRFR